MIGRSLGHNLARLLDFSGRESRRLFWPYALIVFVAGMVANLLLILPVIVAAMQRTFLYLKQHPEGFPQPAPGAPARLPPELMPDMGPVMVGMGVVGLLTLLLLAAAIVRRLHDRDRTGWWAMLPVPFQLAAFVTGPATYRAAIQGPAAPSGLALVGQLNTLAYWAAFITLLVMLVGESKRGANRFGEAESLI
jgi:uncharacterized membrane protein YhaH (DUF805 family)